MVIVVGLAAAAGSEGIELDPYVQEVESVGHAAEDGDGDGKPAVDEEAHEAVADGEGIEEERVDEQSGGAHQQEYPVPFLHPV